MRGPFFYIYRKLMTTENRTENIKNSNCADSQSSDQIEPETFKIIKDFEDYEISNLGRVLRITGPNQANYEMSF